LEQATQPDEQFDENSKTWLSNFTPGFDYSDPEAWTPAQAKEAKLEAAARNEERPAEKEEKPVIIEVDDKIKMTKRGQVTINFEPLVKFPAYMIASNNKPDSDRRGRALGHNSSLLI